MLPQIDEEIKEAIIDHNKIMLRQVSKKPTQDFDMVQDIKTEESKNVSDFHLNVYHALSEEKVKTNLDNSEIKKLSDAIESIKKKPYL